CRFRPRGKWCPRKWFNLRVQHKINARGFQVYAADLDPEPVTQAIPDACALTHHGMASLVVVEIIVTQFGHMQQAFHIDIVECNKQPETGAAGYGSFEGFTDLVLHV